MRGGAMERLAELPPMLSVEDTCKLLGLSRSAGYRRMTFAAWVEKWRAREARLRPSTKAQHASIVRVHILPTFGKTRLVAIRQEDVAGWAAELSARGLAPATVLKAYQIFAQLMG